MRPWREAWQQALYGPVGFYRKELPGNHFRTASHAGAGLLADALGRLCAERGLRRVIEVGAGGGELLGALAGRTELDLIGVELRSRPTTLTARVGWHEQLTTLEDTPTLLLGWELLDVVPTTVAQFDGRWRAVWVDEEGHERLGPVLHDQTWLRRWRPAPTSGDRCEIGSSRDEFWLDLVRRVPNGVALAVDYATSTTGSTLTGFRSGREVPPRPDGSCDLTAHVHFGSLEATLAENGYPSELCSQREGLRALGVGGPSDAPDPRAEPHRYLDWLGTRGQAAELLDPAGLGGFSWLLTPLSQPGSTGTPSSR